MTHPSPARMPRTAASATHDAAAPSATPETAPDVDAASVTDRIADIVDQLDAVRRDADDRTAAGDVDVSSLDAQADLYERAHRLLTDALDQLDRV